jgi:hypothetical protein
MAKLPEYISMHWPVGGLNKRVGYQNQSPYYTPAALNVINDDLLLGRERGGSRPGNEKSHSTDIGSSINLISEVRYEVTNVLNSLLVAGCGGVLKKESAGTWVTQSGATLATGFQLTAAEYVEHLLIACSSTGDLLDFDPVAATLGTITPTGGSVPTNCHLVQAWHDRIVLAGDTANPHMWYASKIGDYKNYDYAVTDNPGAAVSGSSEASPGRLPDPITALIRHSDHCIIFGMINSLSILRGDPLAGGSLDDLSFHTGCVSSGAWCYDPEGYLFILGSDGLYVMPPGCGSTPSAVSRELLPEELMGINPTNYEVCMAYDLRFRGIHLSVSYRSSGTSVHYFIDTKTTRGGQNGGSATAAFWPMSYDATHEPFSMFSRLTWQPTSTNESPVLWGCRDGYTRRWNRSLAQDDGAIPITSYCDYGPIMLAAPGYEGILRDFDCIPAANSGDVDVGLRVAKTAEAAFNASAFSTHEFNSPGLNPKARPMARGGAAILRATNGEANTSWSVEDMRIRRDYAGPQRYLG